MKITYEEMTTAMQKAYRSTNTARKMTLFLSIALIVIVSIGFLNLAEIRSFKTFITAIPIAAGCGCAVGALVHGLVHCEFAFKWLFRNLPLLFALAGCLGIYFLGAFVGIPAIIVDLLLLIKKKPLIYPFEHKHFLMQDEM